MKGFEYLQVLVTSGGQTGPEIDADAVVPDRCGSEGAEPGGRASDSPVDPRSNPRLRSWAFPGRSSWQEARGWTQNSGGILYLVWERLRIPQSSWKTLLEVWTTLFNLLQRPEEEAKLFPFHFCFLLFAPSLSIWNVFVYWRFHMNKMNFKKSIDVTDTQ